MIVSGFSRQIIQRPNRTGFRVARSIHQTRHPRLNQSTRAHRTRFQGHVDGDSGEPPDTERCRSFFHRVELSVREGVAIDFPTVVATPYDEAIFDGDSAYWHFAQTCRFIRKLQRLLHEAHIDVCVVWHRKIWR